MNAPRPPHSGVKSLRSVNENKYSSFSLGIPSRLARYGALAVSVVKYALIGRSPGGFAARKRHIGVARMPLSPFVSVKWFIRPTAGRWGCPVTTLISPHR
jgi:hypothetical protein